MGLLKLKTNNQSISELFFQRNILAILIGQLFALSGDKIYQISLIWYSYKLTDSGLMMGMVAFATSLPSLIFSIFAGVIADKYNKKKIMIIADAVRALAVLVLALSFMLGFANIYILMIVGFVMGSMSQLFNPSYRSLIPVIIQKKDLLKVNSVITSNEQITGIVGPTLAAALIAFLARDLIFLITFFTYIVSVISIIFIKYDGNMDKEEGTQKNFLHAVREALQYLKTRKEILLLVLLGGLTNLFLAGVLTIIPPLYSEKILNAGEAGYGILVSITTAGMLAGALGINYFSKIKRGKLFSMGFLGTGIPFIFISFINSAFVAYPLFFVFGFFMMVINVAFITLLQESVDQTKMGTVISFVTFLSAGADPISHALTGYLATFISPNLFYLFCGIIMIFCSLISFRNKGLQNM